VSSIAASNSAFENAHSDTEQELSEALLAVADDGSMAAVRKSNRVSAPLSSELAESWLSWQCRMVAGLIQGCLFLPDDSGGVGRLIAAWPGQREGEPRLRESAGRALAHGRGVVSAREHYGPGDQRTCDLVACPLLVEGEPAGVVALMISTRSSSQQHAVLQLLQWGGVWIETLIKQQAAAEKEVGTFMTSLTAAVLAQPSVHAGAMEVSNRLADRFECERVSLGQRKGLVVTLQALSHIACFDSRTQLVRSIEAAMEEAVDQGTCVVIPDGSGAEAVTRAHEELCHQQGSGAICTVPLPGGSGYIGALTLERAADKPFSRETLAACQTLAKLLGPILEMKQREARPIAVKFAETLRSLLVTSLGPAHLKLKLTALLIVLSIAALASVDGSYKVTAPATIEGTVRQFLVAPQDGYVKEAKVRAGDLVRKGQVIATLDKHTLELEHQKWVGERNKVEKEYQEALAKRDRIELSLLRAQIQQLEAELRLVEDRLSRTRLAAPFDGVVVSGDLSQSLGAPVTTGQTLFEIAPLDSYRVVIEVDEHDVADIDVGKPGELVMAALPRTPFSLSVHRVVPMAVSGEGRNFFRVDANLDQPSDLLRPGMKGVAKVQIEQRKLLWIWTHDLVERLRLWAWGLGLW